jgi:hypothetical protein
VVLDDAAMCRGDAIKTKTQGPAAYANMAAPTASTRPPSDTKLEPAAPVDWGTPVPEAVREALALGPEGERMAPVDEGMVLLPETMGTTSEVGATGVALGTTTVMS